MALEVDGEIVLGLITRPVTEQCWWAVKGGGAHCGALRSHASDRVLRVGTTSELSRSTAVFWAESEDECRRRDLLKTKAHLVDQTMDCVLELVAGRLDLVICGASQPWDLAPGVVIVEEAGGRIQRPCRGAPPRPWRGLVFEWPAAPRSARAAHLAERRLGAVMPTIPQGAHPLSTPIWTRVKSMMLSVKNTCGSFVEYNIDMVDVKGNLHHTSSSPVLARGAVYESWPHPIPE